MITRSERFGAVVAFALWCFAPIVRADAPPPRAADPLESLRERFRAGMDHYKSGRFADAILVWEAIYRELGSDTGYRVAFDLGRAYESYGDSTRAAQHYETYLHEVERRRARGEAVEANVEKQEVESRARLSELAATKGRIRVASGDHGVVLVQVDRTEPRASGFVAYVAPGTHTVIFDPGRSEKRRDVEVREGQIVDLVPPPDDPPPAATSASASAGSSAPAPAEVRFESRTDRPLSPTVLWIAGGVTALSVVVPVVTYANALSVRSDYENASALADKQRLDSDYRSARGTAYASLLAPGIAAAATAGLFAFYLFGAKETRVPVPSASASASPSGASVGVTGLF